ncbi:MAG: glycerol dehydrogenase [Eubacteriales bacterium]|nr:glycerol dehydrogenase [Eubacteriales bacterium]
MDSIFVSPGKYIQGKDTLKHLGLYAKQFGKKPFILISEGGMKRIGDMLVASCKEEGLEPKAVIFGGESTRNEVLRLAALIEESRCDLVVGVGGGKVTDTSKMAACEKNLPVIVCPTIAATDGPTAGRAVLYSEEGVSLKTLQLPASPNVVLVDTEVIAKAPARLLVSGMGDALATYFETSTCVVTHSAVPNGGLSTLAGRALARACFDTLMSDGVQAAQDMKEHLCSEAVEHIIETNTLLSGLGFESGGLGAAHAINKGLTHVRECDALYHGEKVAYGTLAQILMEKQDSALIDQVFTFCAKVGLPVCLADLGIEGIEEEKLWKAAEVAADPKGHTKNEPMKVTKEMVFQAFHDVDAKGREIKKQLGL